MKADIPVGTQARLDRFVDLSEAIELGERGNVAVFSTPQMINLMEHASRRALLPFLDADEETVGIDVQVEHLAATPVGEEVWAVARVTESQGNVIRLDVTAYDHQEMIGRGSHRRAVVQVDRMAKRLEKKQKAHDVNATESLKSESFEALKVSIDSSCVEVVLNRPRKRNAINGQMLTELEEVTNWLSQANSSIRVVVLRGSGNVFCAGDDVGELNPDDPSAMQEMSLRRARLYHRWTFLPQVFVAIMEGDVLGGGAIAAAACDLRLASTNCQFALPEVQLGWPPNYGLSRLKTLVGQSEATRLVLGGGSLSGTEAKRVGLVHHVTNSNQLDQLVRQQLGSLLAQPAQALSEAKRLLNSTEGMALDQRATNRFIACLQTPDAKRSIGRFGG